MQKARYAGLKAKRSGQNFEKLLEVTCAYYRQMGVAYIQKTPEPFRLLQKKGNKAIGVYDKKAQPDFTGTLKGGKSIVFEAKHTEGINLPFGRISDIQEKDLNYHSHLGAEASILISFNLKRFYNVPFKDWKQMKETLGKKSVNERDLVDYQVSTEKGFVNFLGGKVEFDKRTSELSESTNASSDDLLIEEQRVFHAFANNLQRLIDDYDLINKNSSPVIEKLKEMLNSLESRLEEID